MVVIDKFSKYDHFVALAHPFTAVQVAQAFMDNIFKLHGLADAIISDTENLYEQSLAAIVQTD